MAAVAGRWNQTEGALVTVHAPPLEALLSHAFARGSRGATRRERRDRSKLPTSMGPFHSHSSGTERRGRDVS
jgi:hypothetical protein